MTTYSVTMKLVDQYSLCAGEAEIGGDNSWVPLLLTLLYEYNSAESPWRAYLDIVPDFAELDLPMFWSR